jgi:hypothetical protein
MPHRCFSLVEVDGVSGQNRLWALSGNGIKFSNIMGGYKGRVNLRQRKKRYVKAQRIKALAATKKGTTPPPGAAEQGRA